MYKSASNSGGGIGTGNYASAPPPQTAPPPPRDTIQQALDEQEKIAVVLHELMTVLEERLALVLASAKPDSSGATPAPTPVSILDRVRANTYRASALGYRLNDLLNRVQL